jgi:hypothetical protein
MAAGSAFDLTRGLRNQPLPAGGLRPKYYDVAVNADLAPRAQRLLTGRNGKE